MGKAFFRGDSCLLSEGEANAALRTTESPRSGDSSARAARSPEAKRREGAAIRGAPRLPQPSPDGRAAPANQAAAAERSRRRARAIGCSPGSGGRSAPTDRRAAAPCQCDGAVDARPPPRTPGRRRAGSLCARSVLAQCSLCARSPDSLRPRRAAPGRSSWLEAAASPGPRIKGSRPSLVCIPMAFNCAYFITHTCTYLRRGKATAM